MATRGRKPKPTHLKLVEDNPGRRPLNDAEAKLERSMPAAPEGLIPAARAEWDRVSVELYDSGLLTRVDRAALAAYCQAYGRWEQADAALAEMAKADPVFHGLLTKTPKGAVIQNPLVGIANKARADAVRYAAEFGMTPSARSRISATPPSDKKDPFDAFLESA